MVKLHLTKNPTPEQELWLSQQLEKAHLVPALTKANPCINLFGPGPADKRCKTCVRLFVHNCSRRYYKCALRKVTRGPATDHLVNWPACGKYEPRP